MTTDSTFVVPPNPTGIYTIPIGVGGGGGSGKFSTIFQLPDPLNNNIIVDHTITGRTFTAEYTTQIYSDIEVTKEDEANIKVALMEKIVHELFKEKYIEFTKTRVADSVEIIYRARVHAVPDTQVRIIRELKNAGKTT